MMIDYSALVEASVIAPTLAFSITISSKDNIWVRLGGRKLPLIMAISSLFFFISAFLGVIESELAVYTLLIALAFLTYLIFTVASVLFKGEIKMY